MLFGPLSETISSVSCRACALAGDKIAGAVTAPLAATAPADFKKSRRFMEGSRCWKRGISGLRVRKARASRRTHAVAAASP